MRSKELRVGRWKCAVHKHELNVLNFPTELAETFDSKVRKKKSCLQTWEIICMKDWVTGVANQEASLRILNAGRL